MFRGEVYELRASRVARGHEQRERRYGVILQADRVAGLPTVVVAPTSTATAESWLRPAVRVLDQSTRVLVEQLAAVDPERRLGARVGQLTAAELDDVDEVLRLLLDLD